MKKITLLLLLLSLASISNAQNYWKKMESGNQRSKSELYQRGDTPKKYHIFSLDLDNFNSQLNFNSKNSSNILELPNAFGKTSKYLVTESSNFEDGLAKKFPSIKSYSAKGIDDPSATAKISIGTDGVHIMIISGNYSTLYIDPLTKDNKNYISYKKEDFVSSRDDFECKADELKNKHFPNTNKTASRNANDGKLRTFKIAIASTGEYSQFHLTNQSVPSTATDATKKAAVLSAMNTTMARVNLVYERDLSVKMVIVSDNEKLIFLDANTDNLSNSSATSLIAESQRICDNVIGNSNYDIGHTFSTGAGGLAGLGVVCVTGQKGRGVTGRTNPIGDPYDIDYVAHEIGHQFGANHTFNNSCNGNRNGSTAVEPGSGSSIMAYAGICTPNVQANSDDHFHSVSIAEMWSTIQRTATCATTTNTGNNAPTADAGADVSIPKSTPFILKGKATDADGTTSLTYNWEQIDTEIAVMPPVATNTGGPLFRSLSSKTTPDRYFPELSTILSGATSTQWEVLPSVARDMNFSFTVRDNNSGGGASARDDIKITVTDSPAFTISNQATWAQNTTRDITWAVGKSNISPINCKNVNIKLSTDGGNTFSITLASNTPNDGSESILLPSSIANTTNAVILIEAADNIFYNITPKFTINSTPDFAISNTTGDVSVCKSGTSEQIFDFNYITSNGFSETVNLTITKSPTGATTEITPTTINSNGNFSLKVTNLNTVVDGDHIITLNAKSTTLEKNIDIKLNIKSSVCGSSGSTTYQTGTTLVKFNTINNETLNKTQAYNSYRHIVTRVKKGTTHELTVNTNTDDSATEKYSTRTLAWIDWNQNCQFDDDEKFDLGTVTGSTNGKTTLSPLSITVPNNAVLGTTILRVSTKFAGDGFPGVCETGFDGEVEDYTVFIEEATASTDEVSFNNFNLFPNPSNGRFKLTFETKTQDKVSVKLFDFRGRLVESKNFSNSSLIFSEELLFNTVNSGMYLLQIQNGGLQTTKKLIIK